MNINPFHHQPNQEKEKTMKNTTLNKIKGTNMELTNFTHQPTEGEKMEPTFSQSSQPIYVNQAESFNNTPPLSSDSANNIFLSPMDMKLNQPITVGTLFSGIGSPEMALKSLGISHQVLFACEYQEHARATYQANHPLDEQHFHQNVITMDGTPYKGKVDILITGSPCVSYSSMGLRKKLDDPNGDLFFDNTRLIGEIEPEIVIFENVRGILNKSQEDGKGFPSIAHPGKKVGFPIYVAEMMFQQLGYHFHWEIVDTRDFGIPHRRNRFYLVAFKSKRGFNKFRYPKKGTGSLTPLSQIMETNVDKKYFLDSSKVLKKRKDLSSLSQKREMPIHTLAELEFVPCLTSSYSGGQAHEQTIDNGDGTFRKLTPLECQRLQGFPDDFKTPVSDAQKYRQFGNTMSVPVVRAMMEAALAALPKRAVNNVDISSDVQAA